MHSSLKSAVLGASLLLAACGSTSDLKSSDSKSLDLRAYERVAVLDFTNATTREIKNEEKRAEYAVRVTEAGVNFADLIAKEMREHNAAPEVMREKPEGKALIVAGEITEYVPTNFVIRWLLPIVGETKFNAVVHFTDAQTGEELGTILVDKNSFPLGGWAAITQTVDSLMGAPAQKVAEELAIARGVKERPRKR